MPTPLSTYPAQIDNSNSLPQVVDNLTPVQGSVFNALRNAVLAIEATLGTTPNGLYNTVGARLTTLEGLIAQTPIIQITQDLGGTPDSPLVIGIQGRPVADTAPASGQALVWNGIAWIPSTVSGGGGSTVFGGDLQGLSGFQTVIGLQNHPVSSTAPTTGQILEYNGTQWVPSAAPTSGINQLHTDVLAGPGTGNQAATVAGIRGHNVPSPFGTNTFLEWTGSAFTWATGGGGGGTLTGDVNGPSSSNTINYIQGALAKLPQNSGPQIGTTFVPSQQPNGAITAVPMAGDIVSMFFDASTATVWFGPIGQNPSQVFSPVVNVLDVNTLQIKAQVNIPHFFRTSGAQARRIVGDPTTNFIYVSGPPNITSNLVGVIDKTTFQTVGYLTVGSTVTAVTGYDGTVTITSLSGGSLNVASTTGFPSSGNIFVMTNLGQESVNYTGTTPTSFTGISGGTGFLFPGGEVVQSGQGKARDIAPDLTGNIWVTDNSNSTVSKFLASDITTAIANYPVPQPPSGPVVTSLTPAAEACCWDPTTSTLFVGGVSSPHTLYQISSSGSILQTNNTFTTSSWFGYHGMVSYQNFVWASSDGSTVLQIDPTLFNNTGAAYTAISTSASFSGDISIDTFNQSILVQDQRFGNSSINPVLTRISAPGGAVVSSITLPYTTISVFSNGQTLPQVTINVASTAGFPPSGYIYVETDAGTQVVVYSSITSTSFLQCVGGTGTMTTNNNVSIGSVNQNHGWITGVAGSATQLFIGDENTPVGAYLYTNTPGSEIFKQQIQPGILGYTSTIYQSEGLTLGWNNTFPSPAITGIPPIRYFNVTGTGFTFTEQVGNDGNLVAVLNMTGGGGGGSLVVENQGGSLGSGFTNLNFTGAGVTASGSPPNATISIPGFTAGNDLSGSNTSQTVIGIQGVSITSSAPSTGQVLTATGPGAANWQTPSSGGGGYTTIQQNGTPLTQRATLNFPTGVSIVDDNANSRTTANIVITDNNAAGRMRNFKNLRSNGYTGIQYGDIFSVIGAHLQTGGYAPFYGRSICSIGDNVYTSGYDGTNYGALYGINTYTNNSLTAPATPIHVYNTFNPGVHQDGPMSLISFRSNVENNFTGTGTLSGNFDYIFAGGSYNGSSNATFIELGYLTNGGSTYNQVYRNDAFGFNGPIYYAAALGSKPLTTTIAAGSNNVSLPQPIINVAATFRFPTSGQIYVITANGVQIVNYTGTSGGNQFTGCTGGTGQMTTGGTVSLTPEYNHPFFALIDNSLHLYVVDGAGNLSLPLSTNNFFGLSVDDEGGIWTITSPSATLERYSYDLSTYLTPFTLTAAINLHGGPNSFSSGINILIPDGRYMWGVSPNSDPNGQSWVYQIDTHTAAFTGVFFPVSLDTYMAESEHNIAWDGEALWFSTISFNANWIKLYKIHPKTGEVLYTSPVINNLAHLGFGTVGGLTVMDNGDIFMGYADYNATLGPTAYLYRASKNANSIHAHSLTLDVPLTSGFQAGSLTLSGGTFTVNTGITINNVSTTKVLLTPTTSAAISGGVRYTVTSKTAGGPGVGAFTVQAIGSTGSVVSDGSVLDYVILG